MKTYKALGVLMSYPESGWLQHLDEFRSVLQTEKLLPAKQRRAVLAFVDALQGADPYRLQEEYVATFDRGRAHSLHLFEHVHGESRDRGQAMVDLASVYARKGLVIDRAELPDFLPLFLEFLSLCDPGEALDLLGEPVDVIAAIGARLRAKTSPYAVLFEALVALSGKQPLRDRIGRLAAAGSREAELAALDREWEEAAAFAVPSAEPGCRGCAARGDGPRGNAD